MLVNSQILKSNRENPGGKVIICSEGVWMVRSK